jgi:hypothetical protein
MPTAPTSPPPTDTNSAGPRGGGPHKYTVNLTTKAMTALENTAVIAEATRTDVINKALQVYALLWQAQEEQGQVILLRNRDGETERLRLL